MKIKIMLINLKCRKGFLLTLVFLLLFTVWSLPAKADLSNVKDTVSDSRPSVDANHTIVFKLSAANPIEENDTITITFAANFDLATNGVAFGDMDLSGSSSGDQALAAVASSTGWGADVAGQVVTFTAPTAVDTYLGASETITVEIGINATYGTAGANQITNPTAAVYNIDITAAGDSSETGRAKVAIISGVTVSATVDESLTFTIAAVDSVDCTDGGSATAVTSTATTVPFSTLSANTFKKACQILTVDTNAGDGYTMTSQETDQLTNAGADTIPDTTCDSGSCDETTGGAWGTATNNGFGHTCLGFDCVAAYSSGTNFRQFASIADTETAVQIRSSSTPVTNSISTIVYKISVSGSQESGDYSNTVVYIATAQFD